MYIFQGMASLTEPLAACVEFLLPNLAKPMFEKSMKRILNMIENLGPDDFKDKVSETLVHLYFLLCFVTAFVCNISCE